MSPSHNLWGAIERDVWISTVVILSGDMTYFCEYGRYMYFLIGYYLSEIDKK